MYAEVDSSLECTVSALCPLVLPVFGQWRVQLWAVMPVCSPQWEGAGGGVGSRCAQCRLHLKHGVELLEAALAWSLDLSRCSPLAEHLHPNMFTCSRLCWSSHSHLRTLACRLGTHYRPLEHPCISWTASLPAPGFTLFLVFVLEGWRRELKWKEALMLSPSRPSPQGLHDLITGDPAAVTLSQLFLPLGRNATFS